MQTKSRKLLSALLTLAMVLGMFAGMGVTAYAAAPVLSNVAARGETATSAMIDYDLDATSTVWIAVYTGSPGKTAAEVKAAVGAASQDSVASVPNGTGWGFNLTSLAPNTQYTAYLVASNSEGDSNVASIAFTTLAAGNPPVLSNVAAHGETATSAQINYDLDATSTVWIAVYTGSPGKTAAEVKAASGAAWQHSTSSVPSGAGWSFGPTSLTPNTQYTAYLVASNSGGDSNVGSVTFTTEVATAPTLNNQPASSITQTSAYTMFLLDTNSPGTAYFAIYQGTAVAKPVADVKAGNGAVDTASSNFTGNNNYVDATWNGLSTSTQYTVYVVANNLGGDSVVESVTFTTLAAATAPAAPGGFTASPGNTQVTLNWTTPSNGGSAITKYQYSYGATAGYLASWNDIPASGAATTTYTVTGLTNGTGYTFEVRAINAIGDGATSGTQTATPTAAATAPAAPGGFTASPGNAQVVLNWTTPNNGGSAITKYQYSYGATASYAASWNDIPASGAATTSYTVTGLTNGTGYTFEVRAVNAIGDGATSGTQTATPTAAATAPAAPGGFTASPGNAQVALNWTTPSNGGSAITKYQISYGATAGYVASWNDIPTSGAATTSYTVTGLTNGTGYTFEVRAVNAIGDGATSGTQTATPTAAPATYAVTFNGNGGSPATQTKTVTAPATTVGTLPAAPTRANYSFTGWNTLANGTGSAFTASTSVSGNITVYAQWSYNGGNGGDSSNGSSGGGSYNPPSTTTAPTTTWLESTPAGTAASGAKDQKQNYVRTRGSGEYGVRGGAWAKFAGLRYEHDTVEDGAVQVRVYINSPEKLTKDTLVSGYVKGSAVDRIKSHFEKWFKNKLRVVHFDQKGAWGQPVDVAAKVDLTGMDTTKLVFYYYDTEKNTYLILNPQPKYWIDTNGYLHFTTPYAGDIIISEGKLARK